MVLDTRSWSCELQSYDAHPSCSCRAEAFALLKSQPSEPVTFRGLVGRRFSPLDCVREGGRDLPAKVLYAPARTPWPKDVRMGVATAMGRNASVRALAEGLERFSMLHAPADREGLAMKDLDGPMLQLDELESLLFRDEERARPAFRLCPFRPELILDWSFIERVGDDERVLVPTSLIGRPGAATPRLVDATSSGYAAHRSEESAVVAALLENVERDAVLFSWYAQLEVIRLDGSPALERTFGCEVSAFLVTQDIDLPVIMLMAIYEGGLRVSAAAAPSFGEAWDRAQAELLAALHAARRGSRKAATDGDHVQIDLSDPSRVYGPEDHLAYFDHPVLGSKAMKHLHASPPVALREMRTRWPSRRSESRLGTVVDALRHRGLNAWVARRSLPEVFGPGWHVVRALVPGTVELSWGQAYRRLASPRLVRALSKGAMLASLPHPIA